MLTICAAHLLPARRQQRRRLGVVRTYHLRHRDATSTRHGDLHAAILYFRINLILVVCFVLVPQNITAAFLYPWPRHIEKLNDINPRIHFTMIVIYQSQESLNYLAKDKSGKVIWFSKQFLLNHPQSETLSKWALPEPCPLLSTVFGYVSPSTYI